VFLATDSLLDVDDDHLSGALIEAFDLLWLYVATR
jgi:hypothetical protein